MHTGKIPEACRSRATLENARAVLKPQGQLLQNAWDASKTFPEAPPDLLSSGKRQKRNPMYDVGMRSTKLTRAQSFSTVSRESSAIALAKADALMKIYQGCSLTILQQQNWACMFNR